MRTRKKPGQPLFFLLLYPKQIVSKPLTGDTALLSAMAAPLRQTYNFLLQCSPISLSVPSHQTRRHSFPENPQTVSDR